eukprot:429123_1
MGTELATCYVPTLETLTNNDGSDDASVAGAHEVNDLPPKCVPRKSYLKPKNTKSLRQYKAKKERNTRHKRFSGSAEQELEAMEIDILHKAHIIELLRKQNEQLKKQNQQFLLQYGTHFVTNSSSPVNDNESQMAYIYTNTLHSTAIHTINPQTK